MRLNSKELIIEKDFYYFYNDQSDGLTYKVCGFFIAAITFNMCRVSFSNCDFSKREEVDFETLN
tara:strand:- start:242 stop:433 length:192 start_codon:yes stop_codon:yes gene_type:complete